MTEEENLLKGWKEVNKKLLNDMFSGDLLKTFSKEDIETYFKQLATIYTQQSKRYLYAHSTLQTVIGNYFGLLEWKYGFEIPHGDLDSNYRFDIMAQKGKNTIVVEVKSEVNPRELGQVIAYVYDVSKKYKKSRVFLGTDILNLDILIKDGEIKDIILDYAKNYRLGLIFATTVQAWIVPAEFLLA